MVHTTSCPQQSMSLNCGAGRGSQQVRRSLAMRSSSSQSSHLAASNPLLQNADVDSNVKNSITNNQILAWDGTQDRFVNATLSTLVSGAGLSYRVREFFIKNSGDNNNDGKSSAAAVKNIEKAIERMSEISTTYEMVQFWVMGDCVFNTGNFNGIIRTGVLGNIRRGVSIRGLPVGTVYNELVANAAPRDSSSGLVDTFETISILPSSNFTAISLSTDSSNGIFSWTSGVDMDVTTQFIKMEIIFIQL